MEALPPNILVRLALPQHQIYSTTLPTPVFSRRSAEPQCRHSQAPSGNERQRLLRLFVLVPSRQSPVLNRQSPLPLIPRGGPEFPNRQYPVPTVNAPI
ncbi:hypothetical protein NUACC26_002240 [Scytonema sp. NUACC26]